MRGEIAPWRHFEVAKEGEMAANPYLPAYTLLYAVAFTTVVRSVKDHEAFRPLKPYGWRGELWVLWSAVVVVLLPWFFFIFAYRAVGKLPPGGWLVDNGSGTSLCAPSRRLPSGLALDGLGWFPHLEI
jgi:hypothetical protein